MPLPFESYAQLQGFFWVFIRISVIIFFLPLIGARGIPTVWKIGFSLILSLLLFPQISLPKTYPQTTPDLLLGIASEVLFAFVLVFGVRILLAAVQMAGQYMGFQMGFSMARVLDPNEGAQSETLSEFLYVFVVLIFFTIDGHHLFIRALVTSFEEVPIHSFSLRPDIYDLMLKASGQMFVISVKIAAPVIITLFLANLCLGIVARTVPQVNILMIGFPINIFLGLAIFMLVLIGIVPLIRDLAREMDVLFISVMHSR